VYDRHETWTFKNWQNEANMKNSGEGAETTLKNAPTLVISVFRGVEKIYSAFAAGWPLTWKIWKAWKSQGILQWSGKMKKVGNLKSVSSYSPTTTDTSTDTGVIYCVILLLLQP